MKTLLVTALIFAAPALALADASKEPAAARKLPRAWQPETQRFAVDKEAPLATKTTTPAPAPALKLK